MKPQAIYLGEPGRLEQAFGPEERSALEQHLTFLAPAQTKASLAALGAERKRVEVIVTTWGMPRLDAEFLAQLPALRAVFYAAGSVRTFVTEASWKRGVRIVSASAANAAPAALFAFGQIVLCLKQAWSFAALVRRERSFVRNFRRVPGTHGSTVGLLALGRIGRLVADRLRTVDVNVIAYDPFVTATAAEALGVRLCSFDDVFRTADVVSCHLPLLPETQHLIRGDCFRAMRVGGSFVNTARGDVVAEDEMIAVLRERPDLTAVLDVATHEPPPTDSALYDLPNVVLTPHIAGCIGAECRQLGASIAADVGRYVRGEPITNEVTAALAETLA